MRTSFVGLSLLYGLGIIFYGGLSQHWDDVRFVGVLQRIAICYLFASILFLNLDWRGIDGCAGRAARRVLGSHDIRTSTWHRCRVVRAWRQSRQIDRRKLFARAIVG